MNYYAIQIFHARLKVKILKYIVNLEGSNRSLFRSLPSYYLSMSPEIPSKQKQEQFLTV